MERRPQSSVVALIILLEIHEKFATTPKKQGPQHVGVPTRPHHNILRPVLRATPVSVCFPYRREWIAFRYMK